MWLLSTTRLELKYFSSPEEVLKNCPPGTGKPGYAILSHVWDDEEQSFDEIRALQAKGKTSYSTPLVSRKIQECVRLARAQGFAWVWDDTCCIDKRSSAELEEAINSMFRWYAEATICFAYLKDVPDDCLPGESGDASKCFRNSIWFKRGWTLQELLASRYLIFLSKNWNYLGTKAMLADVLQEITGIGADVLTFRRPLQLVPVAVRMSWAANRVTKRVEDQAYSLLGIFDVSMATIYGEGRYAFQRLQGKIMKRHADHTLFAWGRTWEPGATGLRHVRATASDPELSSASNPAELGCHDARSRRLVSEESPFERAPRGTSFAPPSFEHGRSIFASGPSDFQYASTSGVTLIPALEEAVRQVAKCIEVVAITERASSRLQLVHEPVHTSSCVRCTFAIVNGTPFSLAILLCKDATNNCLALPLWPQRESDSCPRTSELFRAGLSSQGSCEGYRLFRVCPETIAALRKRGWRPSAVDDTQNSVSGEHKDWLATPLPATPLLSPTKLTATVKTVYVTNIRYSSASHRDHPHLHGEPSGVFLPSWIPTYLARYNLELDVVSTQRVGHTSVAPFTLCINRLGGLPVGTEFRIHLNRCGWKLFAQLDFIDETPPVVDLSRRKSVSYYCEASGPEPHMHLNAWTNGSQKFYGGKKVVQLTATPWPTASSYCLDIRLGGVYASTQKLGTLPNLRLFGPSSEFPRPPPPIVPIAGRRMSQSADTRINIVQVAANPEPHTHSDAVLTGPSSSPEASNGIHHRAEDEEAGNQGGLRVVKVNAGKDDKHNGTSGAGKQVARALRTLRTFFSNF